MILVLIVTSLLTLSINAMEIELVENIFSQEHMREIPTLKELCLLVIPQTITQECRIASTHFSEDNRAKIKNIMKKIPEDLYSAIISSCSISKPKNISISGVLTSVSSDHQRACISELKRLSILDIEKNVVIKEIDGGISNALFSTDNSHVAYVLNNANTDIPACSESLNICTVASEWNKKISNNIPLYLHAFNDTIVLASTSRNVSLLQFNDTKNSNTYNLTGVKKAILCSNSAILAYTNSLDDTITIFDIDANKQLKKLEGHFMPINDLKKNNNNDTLLASASEDKTVRVWNLNKPDSKECIARLSHPSVVYSVCFNPSGTLLASGSDHAIAIWNIKSSIAIASYTYDISSPTNFISWANDSSSILIQNTILGPIVKFTIPHAPLGEYLSTLIHKKALKK